MSSFRHIHHIHHIRHIRLTAVPKKELALPAIRWDVGRELSSGLLYGSNAGYIQTLLELEIAS